MKKDHTNLIVKKNISPLDKLFIQESRSFYKRRVAPPVKLMTTTYTEIDAVEVPNVKKISS